MASSLRTFANVEAELQAKRKSSHTTAVAGLLAHVDRVAVLPHIDPY